jgi:hypothetical protein
LTNLVWTILYLNFSWGFVLQSKHNVSDKAGLLKLIRMCKEGIAVSELKDSYPGVAEDIEVSFDECGRTKTAALLTYLLRCPTSTLQIRLLCSSNPPTSTS